MRKMFRWPIPCVRWHMGPVSLIGDVDLENLANIAGMEVPKRVVLLDNTGIYEVSLGKIIHIDLAAHEDEACFLEDSSSHRGTLTRMRYYFAASKSANIVCV